MATHTFVHFEHDDAEPLARLTSIQFDLRSTIDLCEYLEKQAAASERGYPIEAASEIAVATVKASLA